MTRLVVLTLLSGLLVGALALPAGGNPRARGKVIRVERQRGTAVTPRVCDVRADKAGTCLGPQPTIGEVITVLDETGVIAEVRISEATAFSTGGSTACQSLWNIKTEVIRGDLASIPLRTIGVVDPEVHPRKGRMMSKEQFPAPPSGRTDEQVVVAVDRDGDRTPDIVLTQAPCDQASPGGSCIDEWARVNGRLVKVQQTNFSSCGF
ncbi:MAG: hypothetical protein H0T42_19390 [Deltaproteobacteria bacterium]|nr:hypothetical protein [Deltaproteobacteria bacterium]